jgi:Flp pilus assembly protein TadB
MATRDRQRDALQTIFSFFVGLMVLAFIGVGVNTFYEAPQQKYSEELNKLSQQQSRIDMKRPSSGSISPSDQAEWDRLQKQIDELNKKQQAEMEIWARNTSIVLVVFATLVMGVSLIRSEQLRVLSNGLLLGGLFTMLYGTGWVIFSGSSWARFLVILFALGVTIGLGYLKFVRGRKPESAAVGDGPVSEEIGSLEARVAALESRQMAAAAALGADQRGE